MVLSYAAIVNRGEWLKQRCQNLCWKVFVRAQSIVFRSYTMHELRSQNISICYFLGQQ